MFADNRDKNEDDSDDDDSDDLVVKSSKCDRSSERSDLLRNFFFLPREHMRGRSWES